VCWGACSQACSSAGVQGPHAQKQGCAQVVDQGWGRSVPCLTWRLTETQRFRPCAPCARPEQNRPYPQPTSDARPVLLALWRTGLLPSQPPSLSLVILKTHARTHMRTQAHTWTCALTHRHAYIYTHTRTRTHACTYTHIHTHAHADTHANTHMHARRPAGVQRVRQLAAHEGGGLGVRRHYLLPHCGLAQALHRGRGGGVVHGAARVLHAAPALDHQASGGQGGGGCEVLLRGAAASVAPPPAFRVPGAAKKPSSQAARGGGPQAWGSGSAPWCTPPPLLFTRPSPLFTRPFILVTRLQAPHV